MLARVRTRFAPTPSGYLHAGNLVNATLCSWLAQQAAGQLALRIDDDDRARYRPQYAQHIFQSLSSLGIDWQIGPPSLDEYLQCDLRIRHRYLRHQLSLLPSELTFSCTCTRTMLVERACTCREDQLEQVDGQTVLRVFVPDDLVITVGDEPIEVKAQLGDFVVWRRDDIPAYHWANVIDDRDLGVTHVVRGRDLISASAAHIYLARLIGAQNVAEAIYLHHELISGADGRKLSKSQLTEQGPLELDQRLIARIRSMARELGAPLGISPA